MTVRSRTARPLAAGESRFRWPAVLAVALALVGVMGVGSRDTPQVHADPDTWTQLEVAGPKFAGRQGASMVFDAANRRMIVFGGWTGTVDSNETWALDLDDPRWYRLEPEGKAPGARSEHVAIYDPRGERMFVFGGWTHGYERVFGDVQVLELEKGAERWESVVPSGIGPEARYASAAVLDEDRDRIILFGGSDTKISFGDCWSLDISGPTPVWHLVQAAGTLPISRESGVAVVDAGSNRMALYGGYNRFKLTYLSDTSVLVLDPQAERWFPLSGRNQPPARKLAAATYDAANRRMLLYGGSNPNERLGDLWELDFDRGEWNRIHAAGPGPGRRFGHALAFDPTAGRVLLFGGYAGETGLMSDVWALKVVPEVPTPTPTVTATSLTPALPTTPSPSISPTGPTPGTGTASPTLGTPGTGTASASPSTTAPTPTVKARTSTPTPEVRRIFLPRLINVPLPPPTPTPTATATPTPVPCATEEIEPNNRFSEADMNPAFCPDTSIRGTLSMAGDDDVYRVLLDTETDVDFDLWNIPPHTDYDLYVFGPDHANLGESIGDGTTDETIHLHLLPGTYYFRVFPNEGLSPQSYRVRWFPHP